MREKKHKTEVRFLERLASEDRDLMKSLMKEALEEVLEAEMTEMILKTVVSRFRSHNFGEDEALWAERSRRGRA
jgi:hypothetical protein